LGEAAGSPKSGTLRAGSEVAYDRRVRLSGFEVTNWYGYLRARLDALGLEATGNWPEELAAVLKSEIPKWAKPIKEVGIKAE
jgi:hypothetical protein